MRYQFIRCDTLPRLGWCAQVSRGSKVVRVYHGPWLEFRLRIGFLNFSPLYTAGLHLSAMSAITTSEEMALWRLGGDYDRPIARRIHWGHARTTPRYAEAVAALTAEAGSASGAAVQSA